MNRIRQHYHWVIAVLAFWEMIVFGGLLNSSAIFIIPITESLGISRGVFALTKLPYSIVGTVGTMLSGWLYQKLGYKNCMIAGLLLTALTSVLTAVGNSAAILCLAQFLLGISYSVCCIAGAVYIVKEWFVRHQGLIMGAVTMSSALGGSLMTLVLTPLMESWGWRGAQLFLAAICAVTALMYAFIMKDRPEDMHLQPYGCGDHTQAGKTDALWPGLTFRQWLRRPLLYLMTFATFASCLAIYMVSSVLVPYFQDLGFAPSAAAGYQSTIMLVLSGAILVTGAASDRIGARIVTIFCMLSTVLGQFLLMQQSTSPVICFAAVSLCGIGLSMTVVMLSLLSLSLFGSQSIDAVNSLVLAMPALASLFASPISNFVFDTWGTYTPAFQAATFISAAMVVVHLIMFLMANKEKARIG